MEIVINMLYTKMAESEKKQQEKWLELNNQIAIYLIYVTAIERK
jgi:hypothetical protein